ncbi:MAG: hypothetical protein MJB12_05330 [Firmicutes bacterium]|nr:hypothetical protein [Bacillota bacterium]
MEKKIEAILEKIEYNVKQFLRGELGPQKNMIARILQIVGFSMIILGILGGMVIGNTLSIPVASSYEDPHPLRWVFGFVVMFFSFLEGLVFIAFGEIIKLLHFSLRGERSRSRHSEFLDRSRVR